MHLSYMFSIALGATTQAFSFSEISSHTHDALTTFKRSLPTLLNRRDGGGSCPPIWGQVARDLSKMFLDTSSGQCNDDARAAIRLVFHDCGTWDTSQGGTGGCDGSLVNTIGLTAPGAEELSRSENNGLQDISLKLVNLRKKFPTVSMADLIVFASSVAVASCPGGPVVKTFIGRKDSAKPAPDGRLPDVSASANSLFALFQAKGFNAKELAALLGAHSTSKSFHQSVVPEGCSQDSTPGLWDVAYYAETLNPPMGKNVGVFPSDAKLAVHPQVGKEFKGFVGATGKWNSAFADA
jgi:hypothetical protein